jgi:L-aminopeptidase/D-esterase-like protein
VFLVGGDVFGLVAAEGIQRWLVEKGIARARNAPCLPAVVGANIYDLNFCDPEEAVYSELGYSACVNASDKPVLEGDVGAGISATVGKFLGIEHCSKGGIGSSSVSLGNGLQVGALVVTNAEGNIKDPENGTIIAGAKSAEGKFVDLMDVGDRYLKNQEEYASTTIAIVATNACLSHEHLMRATQMATAGMARTIDPVHTCGDGDTVFGLATDSWSTVSDSACLTNLVGFLGARQLGLAIKRSVLREQ